MGEDAPSPRQPVLDVELVKGELVHEGAHQVVCGKIEDETEGDRDGQGGQSFLEDG